MDKWFEPVYGVSKSLPVLRDLRGKSVVGDIKEKSVVYGCQVYSFDEIRTLYSAMVTFVLKDVIVKDSYKVSFREIEQIVDFIN